MSDDGARRVAQPLPFQGVSMFSNAPLTDGSRFTPAPIPTGMRFELGDEDGQTYFIFVIDDPRGIQRFVFPLHIARQLHAEMGQRLDEGSRPRIQVAQQVPPVSPHPPDGRR